MSLPWKRRSFLAALGSAGAALFLDPRLGTLSALPPEVLPTSKVVGVGGAGCAVLDYLILLGVDSTGFIAVDSDIATLDRSRAPTKVQIGRQLLHGLGAGARWENGHRAAVEDLVPISRQLKGVEHVILACGLGGAIGGGATPVIAHAAQSVCGAEVSAVAARPIEREGLKCRRNADHALEALQWAASSVTTVSFPDALAGWVNYDIACFQLVSDMAERVAARRGLWRRPLRDLP